MATKKNKLRALLRVRGYGFAVEPTAKCQTFPTHKAAAKKPRRGIYLQFGWRGQVARQGLRVLVGVSFASLTRNSDGVQRQAKLLRLWRVEGRIRR